MANQVTKRIVCLGGGIGTVNLLSGLKDYPCDITAVVSMADDGGSSGRLRRLYNVFPPGDVISCLSALSSNDEIKRLLTYRFAGDRYGKDTELGGHKLGNLLLTALSDMQGGFVEGIKKLQRVFDITGTVLPATSEMVTISARTTQNRYVYGEEKIDLGKYQGKRILKQVFLHPTNPQVTPEVLQKIQEADAIILGPGDVFTAQLPVAIIPKIKEALLTSTAKKIYIVNIANKPYETRGYRLKDYIDVVTRHLGVFPFDTVVINSNYDEAIPKKYHYSYVPYKKDMSLFPGKIILKNLVRKEFPLYHDSKKLAKVVWETI